MAAEENVNVNVDIDQYYDVQIDGTGDRGDGVGHIDRLVVFVRGKTELGKNYRVVITKRLPRYAVAEVFQELK